MLYISFNRLAALFSRYLTHTKNSYTLQMSSFYKPHGVLNLVKPFGNKPVSLIVFVTVMVCQFVLAGTIKVPKDHITIQAGINAAVDGDMVLVADGLYMGIGNVNLDFKGKLITVKSANGADKCMIDCQKVNQTRGFIFRHQETKDAIVSGFTIRNGNFKEGNGGGIHCFDASPTIISCILTENVAEAGGGIFCDNALPLIIDCLITKNQAKGGGGIQSHRGSPTITGCRISENVAGTGGGIFLAKSSVVVTNTLVYKNQADYGGGILCSLDSLLFLHSSTITDNIAMYGGGLFFSESDTMLVNSILHQNSESIKNEPQQIYFGKSDQPTVADISYCLIQGGRTGVVSDETITLKWGAGNISDDPMFVNPIVGDYRLQDDSLGIAGGIKDGSMPTVDIAGRNRPFPADSRPDLGAYEHNRGKRVSDQRDEPLTVVNRILITTNKGKIQLEVYPESAPITVKNFYRLIQGQFYDGLIFHRYVPKFVIQGGCPLGTGAGGPGWTIRGEFQDPSLRSKMPKHTRGVLAMARAQNPDSAGSQFYICLEDAPHLDGNYTAFGRVVEGMEVVDRLRQGDKMVSVQLIPITAVPRVSSIITIPDTKLRSALEQALGKNEGDAITKDNLAELKELKAENSKISDLTGLEHSINLSKLELQNNQLSDISPLATLINLTWLNLTNNQISDVSPLAKLTNLTDLGLSANQIKDISPLVNNVRIKGSIYLKGNPLSKTSVLAHIPALTARGVAVEFDSPAIWGNEQVLVGDVNGDNQVDLFDLVEVASMFGKKGEGLTADISGDGQVDLFDLVQVAGNFGKSNAAVAPTVLVDKRAFTTQQKYGIQSAIMELEDIPARSEAEELILSLLIATLPDRFPEQTQLLPNYPNPFNPETWIPFELSQGGTVSVIIYDLRGASVRTFSIGYLQSGRYTSQSKAIYWDGRTDTGEKVASGIYLYQIQVGNYIETRKMVILK